MARKLPACLGEDVQRQQTEVADAGGSRSCGSRGMDGRETAVVLSALGHPAVGTGAMAGVWKTKQILCIGLCFPLLRRVPHVIPAVLLDGYDVSDSPAELCFLCL